MYPLTTYLQPHNFKQDQFQDINRSKDEAIQASDQDTFLSPFHQAQYFSESAIWGNCERLLQEGPINLSSSTMSNSRKRKSEMFELHGISRKDKHSKVCTARGPRDRRVRLSPRTAIQFYDVQDRLGYDRPSKAIDWLIKEAKTAIDALEEQQQQQTPLGSDNQLIPANGKFQGGIIGKQEDLDDDAQDFSFGFFIDRALEDSILNPGYQQGGFISGLAANFDTNWEVARLQRISGNNQGFCQAEAFQSSIVNYSPIGISFPGFNLVNELSNVTAPGMPKDGVKERTDLSKTSSFLQYQVSGGISG